MTAHTDLVPTVFEMVGLVPHADFDGVKITLTREGLRVTEGKGEQGKKGGRHEHVGVEYWGCAVSEGKYGREMHLYHTYKALRVRGEGYDFYYAVWCDGGCEVYDMVVSFMFPEFENVWMDVFDPRGADAKDKSDPWQMHNIHPTGRSHQLSPP